VSDFFWIIVHWAHTCMHVSGFILSLKSQYTNAITLFYACLQSKCKKQPLTSLCLSVHLYVGMHETAQVLPDGFLWNLMFGIFTEIHHSTFHIWLRSAQNNRHFTQISICIYDNIPSLVFVIEAYFFLYEIWSEAEEQVGNLSITIKLYWYLAIPR
jgi:hypothetical protein